MKPAQEYTNVCNKVLPMLVVIFALNHLSYNKFIVKYSCSITRLFARDQRKKIQTDSQRDLPGIRVGMEITNLLYKQEEIIDVDTRTVQ